MTSVKQYFLGGTADPMGKLKGQLSTALLQYPPVNRGSWQSLNTRGNDNLATYEMSNAVIISPLPYAIERAQYLSSPDLPWADDHFNERIGGLPLNPPPSHRWWPWHKGNEDKHIDDGVFSHTYPERMWPRTAHHKDPYCPIPLEDMRGIRYRYGDLEDVINQLRRDSWTRQAFLPIWFPEDTGAVEGQRVPCSIGYHFIRNGANLDVNYFLRSCDLTRHFHNDVYFTMRLAQYVSEQVRPEGSVYPLLGNMTMFISNLHMFRGDSWRYQ